MHYELLPQTIDCIIGQCLRLTDAVVKRDNAGVVYVLDRSHDPELFARFMLQGTLGLYSRAMDLACESVLRANDDWHGRGLCIVLDIAEIAATLNRFGYDVTDDLVATVARSVFLHELAHGLELIDEPPAEFVANVEAAPVETLERVSLKSVDDLPPFFCHDLRWLRTLLHLQHRAERSGIETKMEFALFGNDYGYSNTDVYRDLLAEELTDFEAASFDAINSFDPPAQFVDLWRADVRSWFLGEEQATARATQVVIDALSLYSATDSLVFG